MDLALSRLSRYTSRQLTANDLEDPFKKRHGKIHQRTLPAAPTATIIRPIRRSWPNVTASVPTWTPPKPNGCLPLNLEGSATRNTKQLYLNVAWNVLDIAARHNVERNAKSLIAAEAKSEQILRDMNERVQTSAIDMQGKRAAWPH